MGSDTTESLEQKARSLELLYSVVSTINITEDQEVMSHRILEILRDWLDARAATMHRFLDGETLELVAAVGSGKEIPRTNRLRQADYCPCAQAMEAGYVQNESVARTCCGSASGLAEPDTALRQVSVPVQTRNRVLGVINLFVCQAALDQDEDWAVVLTSIGQNLGLVIERSELVAGSEKLSRMEERTYLAHELHDSLAQTLAGIRYNVRVLENVLDSIDIAEGKGALEAVEASVEEANRELRELINRFHKPDDQPGLIPSIEELTSRFMRDTGIKTVLQNSMDDIEMPMGVEMQIVRIVQEALTNVRKHAEARTVRVMVRKDGSSYHVLIEDDGRGFDDTRQSVNPRDHIGLQVMSERALRIGGSLDVESVPSEGTRVHLKFSR